MRPAVEPDDDEPFNRDDYIPAHDLERADARIEKFGDEFVLLRLFTTHQEFCFKLSRADFVGLSQDLSDEARRMRSH